MNAFVALLTAASVLAHAALGCCIHHSHDPNTGRVAGRVSPRQERGHHTACAKCCCHNQSDRTPHSPATPAGNCGEQDCVAVAGAPPTHLLKVAATAFHAAALDDLAATSARRAGYIQFAAVQHDLGPPMRPHLCFRVLLI